ncbi:MAG TPA: hypothetical protein VNM37_11505, partial [Candidatus Dormibacteraeota bacterium]|nr:hypothetical protein [Candidatus Dormibacteraeota bacterium]
PAPNVQTTVLPSGYVTLSWSDQSDNELGFALERSTDGFSFQLVDTIGANLQSYTDRTVSPGTTYHYRLRAYNPGGSSDYTYAPAAVTIPQLGLPTAPSSLGASAVRGAVNLSWSDPSNNEGGFQIERRTGNGAWQVLTTVAANTVAFTDSSVVARTKYSYRVRAFNVAGASSYSNQVTVTAK